MAIQPFFEDLLDATGSPDQRGQALVWARCELKPTKPFTQIASTLQSGLTRNFPPSDSRLIGIPPSFDRLVLPGVSEVKVRKKMKFEALTAPMQNNGTIVYRGYDPAEVEVTFTWWTPTDHVYAMAILDVLSPSPDKTDPNYPEKTASPPAFYIVSPVTAARRIDRVIVGSIEGPNPGKYRGSMSATLSLTEWRDPPAKPVNPNPTIGQEPNDVTGYRGRPPQGTPNAANLPSKTRLPSP